MRAGELQHIEVLLVAWALWSLHDSARLGYQHQSLIFRMMREGAAGAAIRRIHISEIPSSPAVEAVEAAVVAMPEPLRAAIKARYLHLHQPTSVCAQRLHMSPQGFARAIERGQWWLAGRLSR
ncbi:MAG: hypothetical protein ACREVE_05960 [Gammaproteobacteria bacterium]